MLADVRVGSSSTDPAGYCLPFDVCFALNATLETLVPAIYVSGMVQSLTQRT
jgi:hypothetical protein